MVKVIGYTYEADHHCVACTRQRYMDGGFSHKPTFSHKSNHDAPDEHGVSMAAEDNEGNLIHPIMSTDELPCDLPAAAGGYNPVVCGDCGDVIRENDQFDDAAEQVAKPLPHVVLTGNPISGFTVIGMFTSSFDARNWGRSKLDTDVDGDPWWIMPLRHRDGRY